MLTGFIPPVGFEENNILLDFATDIRIWVNVQHLLSTLCRLTRLPQTVVSPLDFTIPNLI